MRGGREIEKSDENKKEKKKKERQFIWGEQSCHFLIGSEKYEMQRNKSPLKSHKTRIMLTEQGSFESSLPF